jgi:hypothetical protein
MDVINFVNKIHTDDLIALILKTFESIMVVNSIMTYSADSVIVNENDNHVEFIINIINPSECNIFWNAISNMTYISKYNKIYPICVSQQHNNNKIIIKVGEAYESEEFSS